MGMAAIIVMWPLIFVINLLLSTMKFELDWFLRKLFKYIDGTPIWEILADRSKVNLDFWNLFIAIVTLLSTYEVRIMTLASTVFKKNNLSKKFQFKCIRKHIWPWHKVGQGQPRIIIWTNIAGPTSPMLTYQVPRSWAFWFLRRCMGMLTILVMWPEQFV